MSYIAVAGLTVSVVTSIAGGQSAKREARKQRALMKQLKLQELALEDRLTMEQIRAEQENVRTNVLANSLLSYRETLQKESTQRLKDTWLYATGIGVSLGIFYGLYLMYSED
jgi:hypothetical protein